MFFIQISFNLTILIVSLKFLLLGNEINNFYIGFVLLLLVTLTSLYTISLYVKKALRTSDIDTLKKNPILIIPCHRKSERCININGKPMRICARCLSMLLGYLSIPLMFHFPMPFWIGVFCQIPMIADGYTQMKKWRTSNNYLRVITGLISGIGLSICIVSSVIFLTH